MTQQLQNKNAIIYGGGSMVVDSAVFLASDRAGAITGTILNVTCGLVSV